MLVCVGLAQAFPQISQNRPTIQTTSHIGTSSGLPSNRPTIQTTSHIGASSGLPSNRATIQTISYMLRPDRPLLPSHTLHI